MKLQELFGDTVVLGFAVPLAITPLGFVYLNDNGVWNITVNWKNSNCIDKTITIRQLQTLFEQHASCYPNQQEHFEEKRQLMLQKLQAFAEDVCIDFK